VSNVSIPVSGTGSLNVILGGIAFSAGAAFNNVALGNNTSVAFSGSPVNLGTVNERECFR